MSEIKPVFNCSVDDVVTDLAILEWKYLATDIFGMRICDAELKPNIVSLVDSTSNSTWLQYDFDKLARIFKVANRLSSAATPFPAEFAQLCVCRIISTDVDEDIIIPKLNDSR